MLYFFIGKGLKSLDLKQKSNAMAEKRNTKTLSETYTAPSIERDTKLPMLDSKGFPLTSSAARPTISNRIAQCTNLHTH